MALSLKPAGCRPQGTEQMSLCGNTRGNLHNEGILSCMYAGPSENEASSSTPPHPPPHTHFPFLAAPPAPSISLSPSALVLCLGL